MFYNIGDIVEEGHNGLAWRYRISSYRDGGIGCPVIRRYTAQLIKRDGSLCPDHVKMPELSHFTGE